MTHEERCVLSCAIAERQPEEKSNRVTSDLFLADERESRLLLAEYLCELDARALALTSPFQAAPAA
jgi:hypothetical protein